MAEDKKSSGSENEMFVYGFALVALGGVIYAVLARIPGLILGAVIGECMMGNAKRRVGVVSQMKAALWTAATFYFWLYTCFGFSGLYRSDFPGALVKFEWFRNFIWSAARYWNGMVPDFLKSARITDKMVTPENVSRLVLRSAITGTLLMIVIPHLYELARSKNKKHSQNTAQESDFFKAIEEFPYLVMETAIETPIKCLANIGHHLALEIRSGELKKIGGFFCLSAIGLIISFCLSKIPSVFSIHSQEITFLVGSVFAYAPLAVFVSSFLIGLIPWLGDSALYHLFNTNPDGAKVIGNGKKIAPGFHLGTDTQRKPFYLTENNLAYHVEIVAPTGSGKTNILKNLIRDRIEKGHGVIFIDYKADFDVLTWMYRVAKSVGRTEELRLISLANPDLSVPYNPLEGGTASELTSRLLNSFEWSTEQYYLNASKSALSRVMRGFVEYRALTGSSFNVGHVHKGLTDSNYLRMIATVLRDHDKPYASDLIEIAAKIDKPSDAKEIRGLISNLESLMFSSVGPLLTTDTEHGSYGLEEAVGEGRITYCLMNSLLLKESSKALGKLFLQDLMSFVGRRFASIDREENHAHKPVTLVIDEFAAFAIPEFIDFLDRARSAGIGVIIAHQDRADLKSISQEFQSRVEANTNTTIVSGVKDPKDAEHFAGMIGTRATVKETWQEADGFFGGTPTGVKSKRVVDEYEIHPNEIKQLKQGEVLAIARTVDPHFGMVWIPRAHEFLEVTVPKTELLQYFKTTRKLYLKENGVNKFTDVTLNALQPGLKVAKETHSEEKPIAQDIWS